MPQRRPIRSRAATSAPRSDRPPSPRFHAFSFTVPTQGTSPTFVVAGSGEAREGGASYRERTVRWGETSADAMREKALFVLGEMERRLGLLGFAWAHTTATQVYTVHDLYPFLADDDRAARRGPRRPHLALLPPARAGPRVRDGLPRRGGGAFRGLTSPDDSQYRIAAVDRSPARLPHTAATHSRTRSRQGSALSTPPKEETT